MWLTMREMKYELHNDLDADLPLIFGYRALSVDEKDDVYLHWHDCVELIYCVSGEGWVLSGAGRIPIREGDIAIVNAGNIHDVFTESACGVYSFDPGNALLAPFHLAPEQYIFQERIRDKEMTAAFDRMIAEMTVEKDAFYQQAVHMEIIGMMLTLMRNYRVCDAASRRSNEDYRTRVVKLAISYLREHFLERIEIDKLCAHIDYSKYYLCRTFKEITGFTVIQYVNNLKCQYARNLLLSGQHNVNESAAMSGFSNDSYFSKTYKAVFGKLPSEELKQEV